MCEVLFTAPHHLRTNKRPFKETAVMTPGAEIGKLSHGAFSLLAQGHRARGWQSWGVKPGSVALSAHIGLPAPPSPSQVPAEQVWEAEAGQGLPWRGCPPGCRPQKSSGHSGDSCHCGLVQIHLVGEGGAGHSRPQALLASLATRAFQLCQWLTCLWRPRSCISCLRPTATLGDLA